VKLLSTIFLLACLSLAGCATPKGPPPLPKDNGGAVAQVLQWAPLGTSVAQTQTILDQHGFNCKLTPADSSTGGYLTASLVWPTDDWLHTTWYFTLKFTDDKLSSVNVTITTLGHGGNYQPVLPPGTNAANP
jgi:hypothetical protein